MLWRNEQKDEKIWQVLKTIWWCFMYAAVIVILITVTTTIVNEDNIAKKIP